MAACALLPKMRQQIKIMPKMVNPAVKKRIAGGGDRWKPSPNLDHGFIPWDVVALLAVTHENELFDDWEYVRVAVPPCDYGEPCDKTMQVVETMNWNGDFNWSGVVRVPQQVRNETKLLHTMFSLLSNVPASLGLSPYVNWDSLCYDFSFAVVVLRCRSITVDGTEQGGCCFIYPVVRLLLKLKVLFEECQGPQVEYHGPGCPSGIVSK